MAASFIASLPGWLLGTLLVVLGGGQPAHAQPASYRMAYSQLRALLKHQQPSDFTKAVFVVENAGYSNQLSDAEFQQQLAVVVGKSRQLIAQKQVAAYRTAPNWAQWLWWLLPPTAPGPAPYLKYLPGHLDQARVTFYWDSLRRRAVRPPFLTFLTSAHGQNVTYFIWLQGNLLNAIRLTDSTVARPLTNRPQHFAALLNPGKLAIRQAEDWLKFKPPVNPGATDILFVETSRQPYLVEYGSGAGYVLDSARDADQRYFFQVLRQDLARLAARRQILEALLVINARRLPSAE